MPIINPKKAHKPVIAKLQLPKLLMKEVTDYCTAFDIESLDHFFAEAAQFVLSKDADWKARKKQQAKHKTETA